jgi:phosphopantothenoylcysteine decarboxylase/phosphopantothenate--cysteine ligase
LSGGATKLPRADKLTLARALIAEIAKRLPDTSLIR